MLSRSLKEQRTRQDPIFRPIRNAEDANAIIGKFIGLGYGFSALGALFAVVGILFTDFHASSFKEVLYYSVGQAVYCWLFERYRHPLLATIGSIVYGVLLFQAVSETRESLLVLPVVFALSVRATLAIVWLRNNPSVDPEAS